MNIERLGEIATWLEAGAPEKDGAVGFDMNEWGVISVGGRVNKCGSVCCIGGAAVQWYEKGIVGYFSDSACRVLDLDAHTGNELFYPAFASYDKITPAMAAIVVRDLIATGEVNWDLVL